MAKSKQISSKAGAFAKGGSGHMFGKQSVGVKAAGVSGKSDSSNPGKFIKGGSGKMFGKQSASAMPAGRSGK
jgi:hypothetical protein